MCGARRVVTLGLLGARGCKVVVVSVLVGTVLVYSGVDKAQGRQFEGWGREGKEQGCR